MNLQTYPNIVDNRPVTSERSFESMNPATGEAIGLVPHSTAEQVAQAVRAARKAQPGWAARPDAERRALLMKVADVFRDNAEFLAGWVTREQGKPLGGLGPTDVPGARLEALSCEAWTRVPASLELPVEVVFEDATRRDEMHRRPFGVMAAISPWNWPLAIAIMPIAGSLRAGNTVVLKPSEYTSIGTLEMVRLMNEVLPPGVLNTVTGAGEVGSWLAENPDVDKIMFTGYSATGAKITAMAACRPGFFLPVRVLSRLMRRRFLEELQRLHDNGKLKVFGEHAGLAGTGAFKAWLAPLRKIEWVVYAKKPFAGPSAVLAYLSRYTHRVAISNSRLIAMDERGVTFRWKDYRAKGKTRYKTMTLAPAEFMRRFLLHVLPGGFHRIRHFGLLANGSRKTNLALARELLHAVPPVQVTDENSDGDRSAPAATFVCWHCGKAMIILQTLARGHSIRSPPPS